MARTLTILNHTFYPDLPGGVEWCMWHMARALAAEGVAVRVLTERRKGLSPHERISPGLTIDRFEPMRSSPLTRWHDARQTQRMLWWARVLRDAKPAGPIWCNGYPMTTLGAVLAGRRRDVIFNPSTCVASTNRVARAYDTQAGGRLSRYFEQLDRLAYRLAPKVVVSSENLRRQLEESYGMRDSIHVVPFGADARATHNATAAAGSQRDPGPPGIAAPGSRSDRATPATRLGLPAGAWVVGFVGRLDFCKDLPFLLRGIARCVPTLKRDLRLLVVGDGSCRGNFEEAARALGIADRVHWTGAMADPTPAYAAMDAFVIPSVYETFGYVILEAMAAGLPVIGRRRDENRDRPVLTANDELIRDGVDGLLVSPHDPGDLAAKLGWLASNPSALRAMSEQAARRARSRSWSDYAADLMPLFFAPRPGATRFCGERIAA